MGLDRRHGLAEPERHREVAQVVLERLDDLEIAELQHPLALLDDRHLRAQRGEHRGVLDADHAGARHQHRPRDPLQVQDAVGIDDRPVVEGHAGGPGRLGAGRDHEVLGADLAQPVVAVVDLYAVRAGESPGAGEDRDAVPGQLAADDIALPADHVLGPGGQVGDGDLVLEPVGLPVHLPLVEAGQVEHRLAEGLGRDRAGVQAHPAEHARPLDDGDLAIQLGRGDRSLLAAGPGSDNDEVEFVHAPSVAMPARL